MATAKGSYGRLSYVAETVWGTTPEIPDAAVPAKLLDSEVLSSELLSAESSPSVVSLTLIDFTSESLQGSRDILETNMIRSDRNVGYVIYGVPNVAGTISAELIYGMFDDFLAAGMFNDWSMDVLKNGTAEKYFTIEKGFTDIGKYIPYKGMMVSSFSMNIAPNSIITVDFNFSGKEEATPSDTPLGTPSYATGIGTSPFNSFSGYVKEGGTTVGMITSVTFAVDNNFDDGFVVGSRAKAAIFPGRCRVTGSISAYIEDLSLYTKFASELESSLEVKILDTDGNSYTFLFPRVIYGGESPKIDGEGPIVQNMPFTALYDETEGCTLKITRATV